MRNRRKPHLIFVVVHLFFRLCKKITQPFKSSSFHVGCIRIALSTSLMRLDVFTVWSTAVTWLCPVNKTSEWHHFQPESIFKVLQLASVNKKTHLKSTETKEPCFLQEILCPISLYFFQDILNFSHFLKTPHAPIHPRFSWNPSHLITSVLTWAPCQWELH